uniref:Uncharacterized protein n=1 Tax=Angiostrongylus cantonensis TaxID=6313 RepID=A0A0K0D6L6_ANGCA
MAKGNNQIEENTTLMNGNNKSSDYDESFSRFLYNKDRGTVLGRTAKSWCQITVFYIIFYSCLAAFWVACLAIFLNTLDPKVPRFYGKGTIIGINPGMYYTAFSTFVPSGITYSFRRKIRSDAMNKSSVASSSRYFHPPLCVFFFRFHPYCSENFVFVQQSLVLFTRNLVSRAFSVVHCLTTVSRLCCYSKCKQQDEKLHFDRYYKNYICYPLR